MSIFQEYNQHYSYISPEKMDALQKYTESQNISYDTVVYQKAEWEKFENWYEIIYNNRYGKGPK